MSFFSVIIPLYNKEDFIFDTLNSALNQAFIDFEIIIIDDGSTDNSYHVVSQFKDSKIKIIHQSNQGVAAARNTGIKSAKGQYIALLDADDLWQKNHLFELKKQIDFFPDVGLYCNNYNIYYTKDIKRKTIFNINYNSDCLIINDYFKASIIDSIAWTSAVAFNKKKFKAIGEFDKNLITGQDTDLWIRFALKYHVCFNPTVTASYIKYINDSLSQKENNTIRYQLINKYNNEEKNNPSLKLYLDVNRYAIGLRCKINNEYQLFKKLKQEIDFNNLNFKQKILLNCPKSLLKLIKLFQQFLLKNHIYLSAHK